MSEDILEQLRVEAGAEIERLRARVEVLERVREAAEDVAYGYDPDRDMGAIEASVRALIKTLEAKP